MDSNQLSKQESIGGMILKDAKTNILVANETESCYDTKTSFYLYRSMWSEFPLILGGPTNISLLATCTPPILLHAYPSIFS